MDGPSPGEPASPGDRPVAGWYPDPASRTSLRWWDGWRWTEHVTRTPPPPGAAPRPRSPLTTVLLVAGAVIVAIVPVVYALAMVNRDDEPDDGDVAVESVRPGDDSSETEPFAGATTEVSVPCVPPEWPPGAPTEPAPRTGGGTVTTTDSDDRVGSKAGPGTRITIVACGGRDENGRYEYTPENALIGISFLHGNALSVGVEGDEDWDMEFAPPQGEQLARGVYEDVQRFPFHNPVKGGFSLSGRGGCNEELSTFKIYEITFTGGGVTRFLATFQHRCEHAGAPPTYGVIDFSV